MWPSRTSNCDSCSGQVTTQSTTCPQHGARVAADVIDRVYLAVLAVEQHLPALDVDALRFVVGQVVLGHRFDPPRGPGVGRHPVDHRPAALHEVPADEARRRRDGHAGHAERARRATMPGEPGGERRALQRHGRAVEQAVEEADPPVLAVADRPVGDARDGRGHRRREARRAERARRVQLPTVRRRVPDHVEQEGARPEADRQVRQCRVQRVPGPPAAVQQLDGDVAAEAVVDGLHDGRHVVVEGLQPRPLAHHGEELLMPGGQSGRSRKGGRHLPVGDDVREQCAGLRSPVRVGNGLVQPDGLAQQRLGVRGVAVPRLDPAQEGQGVGLAVGVAHLPMQVQDIGELRPRGGAVAVVEPDRGQRPESATPAVALVEPVVELERGREIGLSRADVAVPSSQVPAEGEGVGHSRLKPSSWNSPMAVVSAGSPAAMSSISKRTIPARAVAVGEAYPVRNAAAERDRRVEALQGGGVAPGREV